MVEEPLFDFDPIEGALRLRSHRTRGKGRIPIPLLSTLSLNPRFSPLDLGPRGNLVTLKWDST